MIRTDASTIALNAAGDENAPAIGEAVALNAEGGAPAWVMLIPRGPSIAGNDGRRFTLSEPDNVVAAFRTSRLALPIDVNHAEFLKAPKGEGSPAAGWIEDVEVRDGAVWGRVEWTEEGAAALNARRYRYLSPAIRADKDGNVLAIVGAGLVNRPNFTMPALNAAEEKLMNKELLKKLGLAETATENDAIAAIEALQTQLNAAKGATPSLNHYVPRADYDLVVTQRDEARTALNARIDGERKAKAEGLVEQAVKDGKIAPATKDFYLKLCASEDGVKDFEAFLAQQPSHFAASGLGEKKPGESRTELNADERALLAQSGLTEEQFLKAREAERRAQAARAPAA